MARSIGALLFVLTVGFLLATADAQDTTKKVKLDFDAIFKKLDTNHDGFLSKDEFVKLADNFKNKDQARKKLTDAYAMIDTDMKGKLSKDQFRTYLENARKKKEESAK